MYGVHRSVAATVSHLEWSSVGLGLVGLGRVGLHFSSVVQSTGFQYLSKSRSISLFWYLSKSKKYSKTWLLK